MHSMVSRLFLDNMLNVSEVRLEGWLTEGIDFLGVPLDRLLLELVHGVEGFGDQLVVASEYRHSKEDLHGVALKLEEILNFLL